MNTSCLANLSAAVKATPSARLRADYIDRYGCPSVAVCLNGIRDLMQLGAALAAHDCRDLLDRWPHLDELGKGIVVAWPRAVFDDIEALDGEES